MAGSRRQAGVRAAGVRGDLDERGNVGDRALVVAAAAAQSGHDRAAHLHHVLAVPYRLHNAADAVAEHHRQSQQHGRLWAATSLDLGIDEDHVAERDIDQCLAAARCRLGRIRHLQLGQAGRIRAAALLSWRVDRLRQLNQIRGFGLLVGPRRGLALR